MSRSRDYEVMMPLTLVEEYPVEPFEWGLTCCPNLFLSSPWLEICRTFLILLTMSNLKLIVIWLLSASQNWPYSFIFNNFGQYTYNYFTTFGQDIGPIKTIQTLSVLQKIQERIGSGTSHFHWFNQGESRTGFLN